MDELKKALDQVKALTEQVGKLTGDLKKANDTAAEKDRIISQKNDDLVKARQSFQKEYKKLADMSKEERDALSEKEIELIERSEKLEADTKSFQEAQSAAAAKERDSRVGQAISRIAGNNKELAETIRKNADSIVGFDKAMTPEEIMGFVEKGFNMTGQPMPKGVAEALRQSGTGEAGGENGEGSFADTKEGQDMAAALNLPKPPKPGEQKQAVPPVIPVA